MKPAAFYKDRRLREERLLRYLFLHRLQAFRYGTELLRDLSLELIESRTKAA